MHGSPVLSFGSELKVEKLCNQKNFDATDKHEHMQLNPVAMQNEARVKRAKGERHVRLVMQTMQVGKEV